MGRKMKRKSQKHLLQRDAFHPSQAAWRKEQTFKLFSLLFCLSLSFSSLFSSATETPPTPENNPAASQAQQPPHRTTFQKHFFFFFLSALIQFPVLSLVQLHYAMSLSERSVQCRDWDWERSVGAWEDAAELSGDKSENLQCFCLHSHWDKQCTLFNFIQSRRRDKNETERRRRRRERRLWRQSSSVY